MEFRKLIGFGKNSFVISLPKKWIQRNNLKKGDTIFVNKTGTNLTISSKESGLKSDQVRAIIINTKDKNLNLIQTEIISSYIVN